MLITQNPTAAERDAVLALAAGVEAADGVSPLNDAARFALAGQRDATHVLARFGPAGDLVGYAQLDADDRSALVFVHPQHRRQGVGSGLLAQVRQLEPTPTVWAFGNLDPAQGFLTAMGLTKQRELLVMQRDLATRPVETLADDAAPDDIRLFTWQDAVTPGQQDAALDELVDVNATAFAHHPEQGALRAADFKARMGEPWFDPAGLFLARDDETGRLLGYHWTKVETDDTWGRHGEVYAIGVHPDAGGRGVGRALLAAGLQHLQQQGVERIILYVEADATRTVEMYRRAGFTEAARDAAWG